MSNFLAVDTSSRYLTIAACKGEKTVVNHLSDCAMRHSVVLMDEIEKTLESLSLACADCDYFVAVTGPGSFTGIRIGVSCVKGFAAATGKKAVGVTVFEMLSYNINSDEDYFIAVDAAHGNYYACGFTKEGVVDVAPVYMSGESLIKSGRPVYGFEELDFPRYTKVDAAACLLRAAQAAEEKEGGVYALYVKKSQAEEEREARKGI